MKKSSFYSIVAYLLVITPVIGYCSPEGDKAFVDASQLVKSTQELEITEADAKEDPIACALFIAKTKLDGVYKERGLMQVARAYIKAGQLEQAFQISQMIKKDIAFKISVLIEIACKYAETGQYDQALQVAKLLAEVYHPYNKESALTAIASVYVESGQFDQALQVAEMKEDDYLKALKLIEIAVYYAKAGKKDKAFELFSRALQVTTKEDYLHYKDRALRGIVDKSVETLEKNEALTILSQALQIAKTIDDLYNPSVEIAGKYAQLGQYDQALQILKMIRGVRWNWNKALCLAEIAIHYEKAGETNKASKTLSQALQLTKKIEADYFGSSEETALCAIASKYAYSGLCDHAIQIVKKIKNPSYKIDALVDIARNYGKAGQIDKASLILSQAIQVSKLVIGSYESIPLTNIGCAYAKLGLYDQALQVTEMIKNDSSRVWALVEIARTYVATGQRDKASKVLFQAFQVAKEIKNTSLLEVIVGECVKAGQYDQAIEVAYALENASSQALYLAGIGHACAKAGQRDKASKILTQALEVAEMIKDTRLTAKDPFFKKTVQAYAELGLYDRALQSVKMIKDISDQVELLAEVGGKYAESGQKVDDRIKNFLHDIIRESEN